MSRILVARLDNAGDVLLAGPAVRAAAEHGEVTMLCGPTGEAAARMLPGVSEVVVWEAPWAGFVPPPVSRRGADRLVEAIAVRRFAQAAILTSFHQSPLPLALLLRMAGVGEIAAVSVDYPGSLLDHRVDYRHHLHEVEQNLTVTGALGISSPDDDRLAVRRPSATPLGGDYVVVHPGASVPARALPDRLATDTSAALTAQGWQVVLTGTQQERDRSRLVSGSGVRDLRGRTTFPELVAVLAGARAIVCGNTGPAHVAAAVGTPVVCVFAPVVPAHRWRPWKVPAVLLGRQDIICAGCRSRICPLPTQACVDEVTGTEVAAAVSQLTSRRGRLLA